MLSSKQRPHDKQYQVHLSEQLEKTLPAQRWQPGEHQNFAEKMKTPWMRTTQDPIFPNHQHEQVGQIAAPQSQKQGHPIQQDKTDSE